MGTYPPASVAYAARYAVARHYLDVVFEIMPISDVSQCVDAAPYSLVLSVVCHFFKGQHLTN